MTLSKIKTYDYLILSLHLLFVIYINCFLGIKLSSLTIILYQLISALRLFSLEDLAFLIRLSEDLGTNRFFWRFGEIKHIYIVEMDNTDTNIIHSVFFKFLFLSTRLSSLFQIPTILLQHLHSVLTFSALFRFLSTLKLFIYS